MKTLASAIYKSTFQTAILVLCSCLCSIFALGTDNYFVIFILLHLFLLAGQPRLYSGHEESVRGGKETEAN